MTETPHLFCFGLGYTAGHLVRRLRELGWTISATYRDDPPAPSAHEGEVRWLPYDRLTSNDLAGVSHILTSIPPRGAGDPVAREYGGLIGGMSGLRWFGYLSTTGVYGDTGGASVSETAPLNPSNDRSRWRAVAEATWLSLAESDHLPVHIFRLAGIYGPGRNSLDQVRAGPVTRISKPGHAFSRIHVADIAAVLEASIVQPKPGAIYNLSDDEPAPQAEVIAYACELLGMAPPPLVPFSAAEKDMSPMARSFWTDNRRIDNEKIKSELGVALTYPSYREGLAALLD